MSIFSQSGLRIVKRDWSILSATQEHRSFQSISSHSNLVQPAARKSANSEHGLKNIEDVLAGYTPVPPSRFTAMPPLFESQAQNKRASPSEKSHTAPPAK